MQHKKAKLEAKLQQVLAQHEATDKAGEAVLGPGRLLEQEKKQEQLKRLERQATRLEAFLVANEPKRGKQGHEVQSNVTDNESAKMFTAHGVRQGYNSQALVDAKHQIILHAGAFGNGQDYGHVAPMLEGAKENTKTIGLGEEYFAGKIFSADSNYHSQENLQTCAQAQLDAYIPDPHFRRRDPRFATQARHSPPTDKKFTEADFIYDQEQDCYCCPGGKMLKLRARRHQVENNLYRRYEADEAECQSCPLRKPCLHTPETGINIWPS